MQNPYNLALSYTVSDILGSPAVLLHCDKHYAVVKEETLSILFESFLNIPNLSFTKKS